MFRSIAFFHCYEILQSIQIFHILPPAKDRREELSKLLFSNVT